MIDNIKNSSKLSDQQKIFGITMAFDKLENGIKAMVHAHTDQSLLWVLLIKDSWLNFYSSKKEMKLKKLIFDNSF